MIKTFRGLLADGGQDQIRLQTIKGKVGYRIFKFQLIGKTPSSVTHTSTVKIYKTQQTTVDATIDFTDSDLLGVGLWTNSSAPANAPEDMTVIFDSEIFNQDIFITHDEANSNKPCNYYLELEVIPLDDAGAEYTTLKDMRQS